MKEQFIPYELALELKELGFDEDCFGYYRPIKNWMISTNPKFNSEPHFTGPNWCNDSMIFYFMYKSNPFGDRDGTVKNSSIKNEYIAAPLWQQAFDWFRERGYNACIEVTDTTIHYYWSITIQDSNDREYNDVDLIDSVNNRWYSSLRFENYDNARIEAIKIIIDLYKKYLDR